MTKLVLPLMMYKEKGSVRKGTKRRFWVVPSWNHLYVIARGSVILDQWAVKHKEKLTAIIDEWIAENNWKTIKEQKLIVNCYAYLPSAKTMDLHNIDKLVLDCMEGDNKDKIVEDDSFILLRYIDFDLDLENPRLEFTFEVGEAFDRKQRRKELEKQLKAKNKAQKL